MEKELNSLIKEFLGGSPFITIRRTVSFRSGLILIFPRPKEEIEKFVTILTGAETPGFSWRAGNLPLVIARGRLELQGQWAAIEVTRNNLGVPGTGFEAV